MREQALLEIVRTRYGLNQITLKFLREGGSRTYLVEGEAKYLLKVVIGNAFAKTSRQSVSIMQYLEAHCFPVPRIILTQSGKAMVEASIDGEDFLIVLQEFIIGQEPNLESRAVEIGTLVGQLHDLLDQYPETLESHDRQFFIGRYLDFLQKKKYTRFASYRELGEKLWL